MTTGTISSLGIGSGLDVNSIISQLMAVERQPLTALQNTQSQYQAELSGYVQLQSALSTFQTSMADLSDLSSFAASGVTSSDQTVLTGTATSSAANGTYSVQVSRLAQAMQIGSSSAFADTSSTTIGNTGDTMTITVGSNSFTVDYGGMTLSQAVNAINTDTNNTGVTATIVHDDSGYHLVLNSDNTGSANALSVSYGGSDPFSFQTLNQVSGGGAFTTADLDAQFVLNGTYTVTSSSNTVTDAIQGVTFNLSGVGTASVTVGPDTSQVQSTVQSFVSAYNNLQQTITSLGSGSLQGDNTLLMLKTGLQSVLNTPASGVGTYSYLVDVGVSLQKDGSMTLDSTTLQNALGADFSGVAQVFANNNQGFAYRLNALANTYLQTGGVIDTNEQGLNTQISNIKNQESDEQQRLTQIQSNYESQFTALDALMSQLQTTQSYLTQMLAQLSSNSSKSG
jgi:flagellar hook-associated protein 2